MNKEQALEKIKTGTLLSELDEEFRMDKDIVLAAVLINGHAFEFASKNLQDDEEVLIAATKCDSLPDDDLLKFASNRLIDNEEFLIKNKEIIEIGCMALTYASDRLINKKEFVLQFVYYSGLQSVLPKFRDDKDVVIEALNNPTDRVELKYASKRLRSDKEVVLKRLKQTLMQFNMPVMAYSILKNLLLSVLINFLRRRNLTSR